MSNIESRADDYEHRLASAGSTDDIISGLVKGAERSRRMIKLLAIILILGIISSLAGASITLVVWNQAQITERNSQHIARNTERLQVLITNQCKQAITNADSTNTILRVLIVGAGDPGIFTPAESKTRIERYTKALVPVPKCE